MYELVYEINGNALYRWDIDQNDLEPMPKALELETTYQSNPYPKSPIDTNTIVGLLGGSSAGITWKDIASGKISQLKVQ